MVRKNNWYPLEIYRFLLNLGSQNKLAVDEIVFNLLREGLASFGFVCDHSNVGYTKKNGTPYCISCYARLQIVQNERVFRGDVMSEMELRPTETFVDRKRKQSTKSNSHPKSQIHVHVHGSSTYPESDYVSEVDLDKQKELERQKQKEEAIAARARQNDKFRAKYDIRNKDPKTLTWNQQIVYRQLMAATENAKASKIEPREAKGEVQEGDQVESGAVNE